ncbi:hypothetical protein MRX96_043495 [Rhipicephalus microplus]
MRHWRRHRNGIPLFTGGSDGVLEDPSSRPNFDERTQKAAEAADKTTTRPGRVEKQDANVTDNTSLEVAATSSSAFFSAIDSRIFFSDHREKALEQPQYMDVELLRSTKE